MRRPALAATLVAGVLLIPQLSSKNSVPIAVPSAFAANPCPLVAQPPDVAPANAFDSDAHIEANFNAARTAEGCNVTFTLPGGFDGETAQQQMLTIINLERSARGFGNLQLDTKLMSPIALNHDLEMQQYGYFEHFSPINQPQASNGSPPYQQNFNFDLVYQRDRVNPIIAASVHFGDCQGEDLAGGYPNSASAVYGWMYQDAGQQWGHRKTVLGYLCNAAGGDYDWTGIGAVAGSDYTFDVLQDTEAPYDPSGLVQDTTAPTMGTLSYSNGTATVTNVSDTPPSPNQAGVTNVVFYENSITDNGGTFSTVWASNQTNNTHSGNGTYTASITINGPQSRANTLHAVAVDGTGNFTDISTVPTASLLSSWIVQLHGGVLTFHWSTVHTAHVVGFQLFAGRHALNKRLIPAHRSSSYSYTMRHPMAGPYTLHVIETNGHVLSISSR